MKAIVSNISDFLRGSKKLFLIPPFQRNYDWGVPQCEELFDDIAQTIETQESHYLGNIIYYKDKTNDSYDGYILIDGQQRVTTVLLLLCAIKEKLKEENSGIPNVILKEYLLLDGYFSRIKLKQTAYDADHFYKIIKGLSEKPTASPNKMYTNYFFFLESLNNYDPKAIYDAIEKLGIVEIDLEVDNNSDNLERVQTIFEKINSTGKDLTEADLVRNYLLLSQSAKEQEKLFFKYWQKNRTTNFKCEYFRIY